MVKNTVIVPVGSKGGFVVKRPPVEGGREAFLEEGIACYKMFMGGLLDITDNSNEKLSGTPYEHVVELCEAIGNVASSILASRNGTPDPREIKLLKPMSQAVQACFSGAITTAQQVSAIVQQIGAR